LETVLLMALLRTYEIDSSRSTWNLHVGGADVGGELRELSGTLVFDFEDVSACSIHLVSAISGIGLENTNVLKENGHSFDTSNWCGIRFVSWRFREIGQRDYWVPGALRIGDLAKVESLRLRGPTPEIADANGSLRAAATAVAKIEASRIRLALDQMQQTIDPAPGAEATLCFQIELVRRMPAGSKRVAA
jgi:polyisoprenoid-binding protein YceI